MSHDCSMKDLQNKKKEIDMDATNHLQNFYSPEVVDPLLSLAVVARVYRLRT